MKISTGGKELLAKLSLNLYLNYLAMKLKISTLFFIITFNTSSVIAQVQETRTMYYGNETREYTIYVPASYTSSVATPILFSFHGGGGDGLSMMLGINDMRPISDTANFIAVYPIWIWRCMDA